jgi:hemolysin activation/secretion protein
MYRVRGGRVFVTIRINRGAARRHHRTLLAGVVWGLLWAGGASALEVPPTPGAIEESLRLAPEMPVSEDVPVLDEPPAVRRETVPPGGPGIPVRRFTFEGNTVYGDDELRAVIADREGLELTLEEIYAAADRLTAFYLDHGYSVALVTVPAQRVTDGIVRLQVIEGRIGELHFEGNERYDRTVLRRHLHAVESGTLVRFDRLERSLLLLNDLPGLVARSVLVPGDDPGTSDLRLRVEETPWSGRVILDNHGPESVGQWRLSADAGFNNLSGAGDRLDLGATVSESNLLRQGRIGWSRPVGYDGGRLALNYSRADYDVGGEFTHLDISGRSEIARARYTHPHVRSRGRNLYWHVGASRTRGRSVMEGIPDPLTDGRVDLLEAGLHFDALGERTRHSASLQLGSNLRRNATRGDGLTRDGGIPLRLGLSAGSERFLADGWSLSGRGELQLSADPLPDALQFGIGGPHSVRGFVASRQRGDQGVFTSAELRRYHRLEDGFVTLRGFVDAGHINRRHPLDGQDRNDALAAAGAGVSVLLRERYSLDMSWAKPVHGRESGDDSNRFWMTLGAAF